jgi:SAM-dependent methyltransferase
MLKQLARDWCPPAVWRIAARARAPLQARTRATTGAAAPERQELDVYWTEEMAQALESWGEGTTWHEIQLLVAGRAGPVLDVACGTGRVMQLLAPFALELHGIDVSDALIDKALARGLPRDRLTVGDATRMPFADGAFVHAYSIGSLEHFTEKGITDCLSECRRVARGPTFHMIPVCRSGRDEGWLRRGQSYFNNSVDWWLRLARPIYPTVTVVESTWGDAISRGVWLVCQA